jgi:hypothetical protein
MKARILGGYAAVLLLVTLAHIWLNIGFQPFLDGVRDLFSSERRQLTVGFLPVT